MCDWEAAEYAEYLLWVEAEKVRVRERPLPPVRAVAAKMLVPAELPPEVAEA